MTDYAMYGCTAKQNKYAACATDAAWFPVFFAARRHLGSIMQTQALKAWTKTESVFKDGDQVIVQCNSEFTG